MSKAKIRNKDKELMVVAKDRLNWVTIPTDTDMNNKSSRWNKVVTHREYLLDLGRYIDLPIKTVERYNELLLAFKVSEPYLLEQDNPSGEYHIKLLKDDGSKKYILSGRNKSVLEHKFMEFLLKSKVISGLTIDDSLYELSRGVKQPNSKGYTNEDS